MNQKTHLPFALFIAFAILLTACEKNESVQERKEYYSDGVLKEITTYRDSVKDGPYVSFYENGTKKEEGRYKDDECDGLWKSWHANGILKSITKYRDYVKDGVWTEWHKNGKIRVKELYKEGRLFSYKYFDEKGNLIKEKESSGGWKERCRREPGKNPKTRGYITICDTCFVGYGYEKRWYENGQLEELVEYKDDKVYAHKCWYENGNLQEEIVSSKGWKSRDMHVVCGGKENKLDFVLNENLYGALDTSLHDGFRKQWYADGKLRSEKYYKDGRDSLWKSWYENGHLEFEGSYKQGEQDGFWREWFENGRLKSECSYKLGERVGRWSEWYENGKLRSEKYYKEDLEDCV